MKTSTILLSLLVSAVLFVFSHCIQNSQGQDSKLAQQQFGGFQSQVKWGEHLVLITGCHDCHTPKKITDQGMDMDFSKALSGHPAGMPPPDVDRKAMESKGMIVTQSLTAWIGPWGISFAANLTPDSTGIGAWKESNFFTAIRKGKFKGLEAGRDLMPPMPWQMYKNMTDDELRAIFAYLKSIKPIKNVVPQVQPPVSAGGKK
jgi:hypothetical protein